VKMPGDPNARLESQLFCSCTTRTVFLSPPRRQALLPTILVRLLPPSLKLSPLASRPRSSSILLLPIRTLFCITIASLVHSRLLQLESISSARRSCADPRANHRRHRLVECGWLLARSSTQTLLLLQGQKPQVDSWRGRTKRIRYVPESSERRSLMIVGGGR